MASWDEMFVWESLENSIDWGPAEDDPGVLGWTRAVPAGIEAFLDASGTWSTAFPPSEADTWMFVWSCRRQLWREAIASGRASVEFSHNAVEGAGWGPILRLLESDHETVVVREWFDRSEQFHLVWNGFDNCWEFALEYSYWEDFEHDYAEHTFSCRGQLVVDGEVAQELVGWTALTPAMRQAALDELAVIAEQESDEVRDLLLLILHLTEAPQELLATWSAHRSAEFRWAVAVYSASLEVLVALATDTDGDVREAVSANPSATDEIRAAVALIGG
jgi:hypothetical protein